MEVPSEARERNQKWPRAPKFGREDSLDNALERQERLREETESMAGGCPAESGSCTNHRSDLPPSKPQTSFGFGVVITPSPLHPKKKLKLGWVLGGRGG